MKSKKAVGLILALVVLAGGGYAAWRFGFERPAESQDRLTLYGNVDHRQVQLAFQSTGRIELLAVDEGDLVKEGQLLAKLDPVRYRAQLDKAEAEVEVRTQELNRLLAGYRPEEIAQARAEAAAAKASLQDAAQLYQRNKALHAAKTISRQAFDDSKARYDEARARLDKATEALNLVVTGPRKEDIAAARAALRTAKATADYARRELDDTQLWAPQTGVIEQRVLEKGDMAFPQTPVFTLALVNPVWIRAYLPEASLGRVKPGAPAEIYSDSYPGKAYPGWVGYISPTAEFTPKQVETTNLRTKLVYRIRVFACNPDRELRLGMPVTVKLDLKAAPEKPIPVPDKRCGAD